MYADDLVLISPSFKGLQRLVNVCSDIGTKLNIMFNDKKTVCIIFRTNRDKYFNYNRVKLNGYALKLCSKYVYLGHIIRETLCDDLDI